MSASIPSATAPLEAPSIVPSLSPIVLHYLEAISSGKRALPSSQASELAQPPHDSRFLKYMRSASSSASSPVPPVDLSYPISNYFINSSHNTYLTGNQLYSESSTGAYSNALLRGCRCIEIDVWDGQPRSTSEESESKSGDEKKQGLMSHIAHSISSHKHSKKEEVPSSKPAEETSDLLGLPTPWTAASTIARAEPRVLHGHTLTKEVPFRDVCMAIRDAAFVKSDLPVIVSLEVHAGPKQQQIMVEILKTTFKHHLMASPPADTTTLPSPDLLRKKILIKVKYVSPDKVVAQVQDAKASSTPSLHRKASASSMSSSVSSDPDIAAGTEAKEKKKKSSIIPELSDLGIYTRSYHFSTLSSPDATIPTHVFSLSEKKLMEVHQSSGPTLFSHNRNFLMRAFPSGLRVRSDNLDPSVFWRKGVQIVALNWQRWDEGMMLNEGMFEGSGGWVLKPEGYLGHRDTSDAKEVGKESQADAIAHGSLTLNVEILAAQDIPLPLGDTKPGGFHPYVKCELHVEKPAERSGAPIEGGGKSKEGEFKRKTRTMRGVEVDFAGEKMEFKDIPGVVEELSFVRFKIQDDKFGKDDLAAWACIRLDRLRAGYRFVHLLDAAGNESKGVLLVHIEKALA